MALLNNPALEAFVASIRDELIWGQILIRSSDRGYELRHVADRGRPLEELRVTHLAQLRQLADFTHAGAFRPLKSAPNLQAGWRLLVRDSSQLELALDRLYPGSIPDGYAALSTVPPVTGYRPFVERQTGMYRVASKLDDAQVGCVIRACCPPDLCLKRRLWSVAGLDPDEAEGKSAIPCLEPCAILLELARKAVRLDQEEKCSVPMGPGDWETIRAALETAVARTDSELAQGDLSAPVNPRRLRLLLEKIRAKMPAHVKSELD